MAPRADLPSLRCSLAGGLTEFGQPSLFLVAATAAESFEMEAAELILDDAEDLTAAALLLATGSTGYNLHSPNSQSTEASSEHCDSEEYLPDLSDIPFSASITSPTFCTGLAESAANCPETPSLETQTPDSETTETVNATSTALLHGLAATSIVTPTSATEAQRAGCHSSLLTVTTLATHLYSSALILPSVSSAGCLIMPGQAKAPSTPSIEPEPSGAVASVNISHGSRVTNVPAIAVPLPNPSSFTSALKSETRASFLNQDLSAATMLPTHLIDPTHTPETETFSGKPCGLDAFIGQELDNASGIHQPQLRRLVQPQELGERVMRLLRASIANQHL
ncbi:unnamed protein product [Protopolystoma xenopodis]|uniref:Uncharacterized protein n=1 Tax=Protopolystoma xenopodis TaxID=117903 RepID=A0A3S5BRQ0_9PLAT|nr:unnamed protein product [Protopolystoma xenopodis]